MSDPRDIASNGHVAHLSLRGKVEAENFVPGELNRVITPVANIHRGPEHRALERQMLFGEAFLVLENRDGFSFGRAEPSGYVGYVPSSALSAHTPATHRVCVRQSLGFREPDLKTPDPTPLSMGSLVTVTGKQSGFLATSDGLFLPQNHLIPVDSAESDPVTVAERLLGAPYLWGGNSAFGLDCSGLVQIALNACNQACPGDSDQQKQRLGVALPDGEPARRGDLMFWKGHVAWVADPKTLVHANAFHMAVAYEPIADAVARIDSQGDGPLTAHKRLT